MQELYSSYAVIVIMEIIYCKEKMGENKQILVSVLIPVYNSRKTIRESIDSVLGQTFPKFELLLMDDGSIDDSAEIIQSYTDSRIKYIPCGHHFVETLNRGIDTAQGKYIALLDHDDLMLKYLYSGQTYIGEEYDASSAHPVYAGEYKVVAKLGNKR